MKTDIRKKVGKIESEIQELNEKRVAVMIKEAGAALEKLLKEHDALEVRLVKNPHESENIEFEAAPGIRFMQAGRTFRFIRFGLVNKIVQAKVQEIVASGDDECFMPESDWTPLYMLKKDEDVDRTTLHLDETVEWLTADNYAWEYNIHIPDMFDDNDCDPFDMPYETPSVADCAVADTEESVEETAEREMDTAALLEALNKLSAQKNEAITKFNHLVWIYGVPAIIAKMKELGKDKVYLRDAEDEGYINTGDLWGCFNYGDYAVKVLKLNDDDTLSVVYNTYWNNEDSGESYWGYNDFCGEAVVDEQTSNAIISNIISVLLTNDSIYEVESDEDEDNEDEVTENDCDTDDDTDEETENDSPLYGIIDKTGQWLFEPQFESVQDFHEGIAVARTRSSKYIYINTDGYIINRPWDEFDSANVFKEGVAAVKKNDKWGYIDNDGNFIIDPIYDECEDFENGFAIVRLNGRWGAIDKDGNWVVEPKYQSMGSFSEGRFAAKFDNGLWGFVDSEGDVVVEPKYQLVRSFDEGCFAAKFDNGLWGLVDSYNNVVIEPTFEKLGWFSCGVALFETGDGFGFINKNGEVVAGPMPGFAFGMKDDFAQFHQNGRKGLIHKSGKVLLPAQYDQIDEFYCGIACVWGNGLVGYINKAGEWITKIEYESASRFCEGLCCIRIDGKWGFIDTKGAWAIEPQFSWAYDFHEGVASVELDGKWGFIDKQGNWFIKPTIERAYDFHNGFAVAISDGKYGLIDKTGKFTVAPQFDSINDVCDNIARVQINGKTGYIDTAGNWVFEPRANIMFAKDFDNGVAKFMIMPDEK